jgi:hypothetical protein
MLTAGQLEQCRQTQQLIMLDRVRMRHDDPVDGAFDDTKGYAPTTGSDPYYDGPARVQARPVQSGAQNAAEQMITVLGYAVAVPWSVDAVRPTDLVEVYASADPDHIGKVLRVMDVQSSTFETARRMSCSDYQEQKG